jgi:hypothetical protein
VTSNNGSAITAWAFIDRQHLDGLKTLDAASYSLYNVTQEVKNGVAMPTAKLYTEYFWLDTEVGYGEAASVVRGGYVGGIPTQGEHVDDSSLRIYRLIFMAELLVGGSLSRGTP